MFRAACFITDAGVELVEKNTKNFVRWKITNIQDDPEKLAEQRVCAYGMSTCALADMACRLL